MSLACFFCDEGANNTALYVVIVFGLMMTGMLFLCVAYARAGAFKRAAGIEQRVLDVEGIGEGDDE